MLAPGVVLTTLALFGTGVALLIAGPPSNTLIFAHKLSFIAWVALMTLHVLGHLLELPRLALRRLASQRPARGAAGRRRHAGDARSALAIVAGVALGAARLLRRPAVALRELSASA